MSLLSFIGDIYGESERSRAIKQAERQAREAIDLGISRIEGGLQRGREAIEKGQMGFETALAPATSLYQPFTSVSTPSIKALQNLIQTGPTFDVSAIGTSPAFQRQNILLRQALAAGGRSQSPTAIAEFTAPLIAEETERQFQRQQQEFRNRLASILPLMEAGRFGVTGAADLARQLGLSRLGTAGRLQAGEMAFGTNIANLLGQRGTIGAASTLAQVPQYGSLFGQLGALLGI